MYRLERAAISENEIIDGLQRAGAVAAVIDARHNDLFLRAAKRVGPAETEGVFKLYAAGDGQTALDSLPGDGSKNSVFARAFIKAIGRCPLPYVDRRGLPLSTTSDAAAGHYRDGVALLLAAWPGADAALDQAIAADPDFAVAHAVRARHARRIRRP